MLRETRDSHCAPGGQLSNVLCAGAGRADSSCAGNQEAAAAEPAGIGVFGGDCLLPTGYQGLCGTDAWGRFCLYGEPVGGTRADRRSGRLAAPGRPVLFRTTKLFLRCFGLSSLEELPPLPDNGESGQLTMELEQAVEQLKQEQEMAEA